MKLLATTDAAEKLGISVAQLRRILKSARVKHVGGGGWQGSYLYDAATIERLGKRADTKAAQRRAAHEREPNVKARREEQRRDRQERERARRVRDAQVRAEKEKELTAKAAAAWAEKRARILADAERAGLDPLAAAKKLTGHGPFQGGASAARKLQRETGLGYVDCLTLVRAFGDEAKEKADVLIAQLAAKYPEPPRRMPAKKRKMVPAASNRVDMPPRSRSREGIELVSELFARGQESMRNPKKRR